MPIIVFIPSIYLALSFYATPKSPPNRPALRAFLSTIPPLTKSLLFTLSLEAIVLLGRVPQVRFFTWVLGFSSLPLAQSLMTVLLGFPFNFLFSNF